MTEKKKEKRDLLSATKGFQAIRFEREKKTRKSMFMLKIFVKIEQMTQRAIPVQMAWKPRNPTNPMGYYYLQFYILPICKHSNKKIPQQISKENVENRRFSVDRTHGLADIYAIYTFLELSRTHH